MGAGCSESAVLVLRISQRSSPEHDVRFGVNWLPLVLNRPWILAAVDDLKRPC